MYSYIKGTLEEIDNNLIVVECNDIGFEINTSSNCLASLDSIGSKVKIYTKLIPKEDSINLYGFTDKNELKMFELLMTVSGVGPKAALGILSVLDVEDLKFAIIGDDYKAISKAPGVGKTTAQRLIIDLKNKIDAIGAVEAKLNSGSSSSKNTIVSVRNDALEALVSLGYSASVAAKALDSMQITENTQLEQLLSDTLKQMSFL